MRAIALLCILSGLGVSAPGSARADAVIFIEDVEIGGSLDAVVEALREPCENATIFKVDAPRYPLAGKTETHLLAEQCSNTPLRFERAAFVFADGQMVQMEALGVDAQNVYELLGAPDGTYLAMENFREGTAWLDTEDHRLVWLSMDARHPNLFAWRNPHLGKSPAPSNNDSTLVPDLLDFESSLETSRPNFVKQCRQIVFHENERVWLPNKPKHQVQIDCFGFPYAGFERKFEAVFGDGKLEVIWVLTGKAEESRLRSKLIEEWGEPSLVNGTWEVFGDGKISLRKDKPEFLILSDEIIPFYTDQFEAD